jgi:hypothetical protein
MFDCQYESVTASRYVKRVQLLLLLRTPQHPTESLSMMESFVLTLCFNTLHVLFHVEGVEGCHQHHQSAYVLDKISGCGDDPWGPWITTLIALIHTTEGTGLFFIL